MSVVIAKAIAEGPLTKAGDGPKKRMLESAKLSLARKARRFFGSSTMFSRDQQPLVSDTMRLTNWVKQDFGSKDKPESLGVIPWDYINEYKHEIPFYGLKEYWYPMAMSDELDKNDPHAYTICGEEIVAYRTPEGEAVAFENKCPHRRVMLSIGQLNVLQPGSLTCRYHGLTINKDGDCIGVIVDGPDTKSCAAMGVRKYPLDEVGGIVWVYMGKKTPRSVLEDVPRAKEILSGAVFAKKIPIPTSHLNVLDNQFDLAHPSVLHRTCLPFSAQRLWGGLKVSPVCDYGLHLEYADGDHDQHVGGESSLHIREIEWHLPNIAFFPEGSLRGWKVLERVPGFHWPVPHTISTTTAWFIWPLPAGIAGTIVKAVVPLQTNITMPGNFKACVSSDISMMVAAGPVAKWEEERLLRTDVGIARARRMLKAQHREELEARAREKAAAV